MICHFPESLILQIYQCILHRSPVYHKTRDSMPLFGTLLLHGYYYILRSRHSITLRFYRKKYYLLEVKSLSYSIE